MKTFTIKTVLRLMAISLALCFFSRAGAQVYSVKNAVFSVLESSCSNYLDVEASDSFGAAAQLHVLTQPLNGTAGENGNYLTYCPNSGFIGSDHFKYSVTSGGQVDSATVYVDVGAFNIFVFPGDADQNGRVENFDILAIGLTYNNTGPSRSDSSALNALAWAPSPYINANPGAADCDGNGIVDSQDVAPVEAFYGDTAPFGTPYEVDTSTCGDGMPFYIVAPEGDTVMNGDTLYVVMNLGLSTVLNKAYGIAFSLNYDTGFIPRGSIQFSTGSSWLLQNDRGLFFSHESQTPGTINLALTKTNQIEAQGGGQVVAGIIPIDDNICGIEHAAGWYELELGLSKIRLISADNIVQDVCVQQPSIKVYKAATGISEVQAPVISVYPNPANDKVFISAENIEQVDITDLTGRKIYSATFNDVRVADINIKRAGFEDGAYLVLVKTATGTGVQKIIIEQ